MRILLSICGVLLVSVLSAVQGSDIFSWNKFSLVADTSKCTALSVGKRFCNGNDICSSNVLSFCFGVLEYSLNCTGSTPYCVEENSGEAVCSDSPPPSCNGIATTDFLCTGEGIYPDPLDCKKFYYCYIDANNALKSQLGACANRYVFDPDAASFCRLTNNYYCTLPNCNNVVEPKNALFSYPFYPYNRQYVAVCIPNKKPLVYKCDKNLTPNLSTIPITCEFKCNSPGLFENPSSNNQYYECIYNSQNQLIAVPKTCFTGWTFVVDHCQPPSTTTIITSTGNSDSTNAPTIDSSNSSLSTDSPTNSSIDSSTSNSTDLSTSDTINGTS